MTNAVVLLSGGLNSTVALWDILSAEGDNLIENIHTLTVNYGQRQAEREIQAAKDVINSITDRHVNHVILDISAAATLIFQGAQSSQVGQKLPVSTAYYTSEEASVIVVPAIHLLLLSLATSYAKRTNSDFVCFSPDIGKGPLHQDTRIEFLEAVGEAMSLATYTQAPEYEVALHAPFAESQKGDIVRYGAETLVPLVLTYSCLTGKPIHCGVCSSCLHRKEGFEDADLADSTQYEEM